MPANYGAIRLAIVFLTVGIVTEYPWILAWPALRIESIPSDSRQLVYRIALSVLKTGYAAASLLHRSFHGKVPATRLDAVARRVWTERELQSATGQLQARLTKQMNSQPTWSNSSEELTAMFRAVFGDEFKKPQGKSGVDWVRLGFQGSDPCTDFRGSGELGLLHLQYLCRNTSHARVLADESRSSKTLHVTDSWYPLALVSIRLSRFLGELFEKEPAYDALLLTYCGVACGLSTIPGQDTPTVVERRKQVVDKKLADLQNTLLLSFHDKWKAAVQVGAIKNVMDNEKLLAQFEKEIPNEVWCSLT